MSDLGAILINGIIIIALLWFIYDVLVTNYRQKKKERDRNNALIKKYMKGE